MTAAKRAARLLRLDEILVERGLAESLSRAQALVLAGRVSCRGIRLDKPGVRLDAEVPLDVSPSRRYVGRGALKLEGALADLTVVPRDRFCLDVGASTGGFTQVLLEAGARGVVALDVGRGQIDSRLRSDARVVVLDGINARYLRAEQLPFRPSLSVIDVSFISLERVLPAVLACLTHDGEAVALVKPQFEVRRGRVGRGGIVRDPDLHREVLRRIGAFAVGAGTGVRALARSRTLGAEGNLEFFVVLSPGSAGLPPEALAQRIDECVTPVERSS